MTCRIERFSSNDKLFKIDQIYLVNMDKDKKRFYGAKKQFDRENILFDRFSAVNGHSLDLAELQRNNIVRMKKHSFFNHNKNGRSSLMGSIGCALTHRKIWEKVMKTNQNTLVFEDDIIIPKNFWGKLNKNLINVPSEWDIVFLGGVRIYGKKESDDLIKAKTTQTNLWNNCGTYAYIVNPNSAKKLLNITDPIETYLDIQMNRHYNDLNVYYIYPSIIKHNFDIPSTRNKGTGNGYTYSEAFINNSNKVKIV